MPDLVLLLTDVVGFFVALMVVLVAFALWVPFSILGFVLQKVPFIGSAINNTITSSLAGVMKSQVASLDNISRPVAHFLWGILSPAAWLVNWIAVAIRDAKHTANQAHLHAAAVGQQAQAYTDQRVGENYTILQNDVAQLQAQLNAGVQSYTTDFAVQLINLQNQITALQQEVSAAGGVVQGVTAADLVGLQDKVESDIAKALTEAEGYTNSQDSVLQSDITGLQGQVLGIPQEILGEIEQTVPGLIQTALAGAGVAAIPGIISAVQALEAEATTCLEPLCDTVTPNANQLGDLGKLLKDLEGLFAAGALMALLVAAVEDPKGTANAIVDVTGWIPGLSLDLVDAVASAAGVVL